MDKIKFRGISMVTKDWIYGDCLHINDKHICIVYDTNENRQPIFSESLGQFTGLYDVNGVEIYEGDLILTPTIHFENVNDSVESFQTWENLSTIIYKNGCYMTDNLPLTLHNLYNEKTGRCDNVKVVGYRFSKENK